MVRLFAQKLAVPPFCLRFGGNRYSRKQRPVLKPELTKASLWAGTPPSPTPQGHTQSITALSLLPLEWITK